VVFTDLAQGKTPEQTAAAHALDIRRVTEVMEFLKGAGIDVGGSRPATPTFATGWAACEVNGVPLLEREVYLARSELQVLIAALNLLCAKLSPDFGQRGFSLGLAGRLDPLASFFEGDVPEPLDVFLMAKG